MGKRSYKYMHTIRGKPASFDGWQICYVAQTGFIDLVDSLSQIKDHRKTTIRNRTEKGFPVCNNQYGHRKVRIPQPEEDK